MQRLLTKHKAQILLFVAVMGLLFYRCNSSPESNVPQISLNVPANANLIQTLRQVLPSFEKEEQIQVKIIPFTGQEKLFAMLAAGQPPDIFYTNTVTRDRLAAEGHLLDLHRVARPDSFVRRIRPQFVERGTSIDGGWYQLCDWTFTYGVYFNKSLFEAAALPFPDSAWTWSGMLDRAHQLTRDLDGDGEPDQYGIFIARHFTSALEQMNGADYPPNALFLHFPPEALEAQKMYLDLMNQEQVMPDLAYTQAQGMQVSQMLNTGRVAMIVEAVPNLDLISALNIEWDLAPLPRMGDKPPRYFRSASGGLSLSSTCRHPEAAWKVMKWLLTESPYNSPNPVFKDVDFARAYVDKHPQLKNTHFRQVWELSEKYDAGDMRDFVRYSSWSSSTILEQLTPKMDLLYTGKIGLAEVVAATDEINQQVAAELKKTITNPAIKPEFRERIRARLEMER